MRSALQLRTILAAVKPESPDVGALCTAARLAAAAGARLAVLSVTDSPWKLIGPEEETYAGRMPSRSELTTLAADRLAQRLAPQLDRQLGAGQVSYEVAIGVPAVEIARWSENERADLLVLGRGHRGDGGTVEGTVRRARVPCLIVPSPEAAFGRILAAVDAGPNSAEILDAASAIGHWSGARVLALHVESPVPMTGAARAGTPSWASEPRSPFSDAAGAAAAVAACDTMVRHGDPAGEILRAVREEGIELLVHGHHRGGPNHSHETGSIAARLLQRAPCAVLTVPI